MSLDAYFGIPKLEDSILNFQILFKGPFIHKVTVGRGNFPYLRHFLPDPQRHQTVLNDLSEL